MDKTILQIVDAHRHLEVILTSNNKWNKHIDSIIESASKQLSYLRKLKYRFSKDILIKLYCTYIRPLLEYASEVWDGCEPLGTDSTYTYCYKPSCLASLNSLYLETGLESLAERRKNKKLSLMYKIVKTEAPLYLSDLHPRRVEAASNYNLRNSQNFEIPFTRLCSFFPYTIRLWNNLDNPLFSTLHPGGTDEYGYPHFSNQHEFALSGGVSFNILTHSNHCQAGSVFISAHICFISHMR